MKYLNNILVCGVMLFCGQTFAAVPSGYYRSAEGKSGQTLLKSLSGVISSHTTLSYKNLWDYYPDTDSYPGESAIWDIYSTKHWSYGEKCGNYAVLGDCYNKEHSVPKSWFNDASPMYSDLMHLYPTDGKVNGQRSNYPYGECANGTSIAKRGSWVAKGKLGKSTYSGYSGTVFEPDDEFKGDLARTYFYMATCYNDRVSTWGSDMFAGNNYPVFSSWTKEMLLKWHRQDPVSDKERTRNEAVYKHQGNRNPYIDYPELVEHVWGDKTTTAWSPSVITDVRINKPVDGSTIDMGLTGRNVAVAKAVAVRTTNASADVTVSVNGSFSCATTTIPAATANAGTEIQVVFNPSTIGKHTGILTVSCGSETSNVLLSGEAVEGIPVGRPLRVTSESFTANWTYVGDDIEGKYSFVLTDAEGTLPGYPVMVDARAESYEVEGLQSSTKYTYTLNGATLHGNNVEVTTADLLPYIEFLFDGDLDLVTEPGVPSASVEILMVTTNIESEITVTTQAPFEISLDRNTWSTVVRMSPDENRLYLRLNSAEAGEFEGALVASTDGYSTDAATIRGAAVAAVAFLEDFEKDPEITNDYVDLYDGTACRWTIGKGGFWSGDAPQYYKGRSLRFAKSGDRVLEMVDDRDRGIGTISFYAARWNNSKEATAEVTVETSIDGGATWQYCGEVSIAEPSYKQYTVTAGIPGKARMRLRQTSGGRWLIDDIAITDKTTGLDDPMAARHQWDAYCLDGDLVIDVKAAEGIDAAIYRIDGITLVSGHLSQGRHTFSGTPGQFFIVASGDFSRNVLIR